MNTVAGLQTALNNLESDKVTVRKQGQETLRGIFDNRDNLNILKHALAAKGGEPWIALFQSMFHTVVLEKKAVLRKPSAVGKCLATMSGLFDS